MAVYNRQIANALRQIKAKGEAVTWRQIVPPVDDDPAHPAVGITVDYPARIAFFPNPTLNLLSTISTMTGTEVPTGRYYGLMGAVDFAPSIKDTVIRSSGEELGIIDKNGLEELNVNGESILWTVRFTR